MRAVARRFATTVIASPTMPQSFPVKRAPTLSSRKWDKVVGSFCHMTDSTGRGLRVHVDIVAIIRKPARRTVDEVIDAVSVPILGNQ